MLLLIVLLVVLLVTAVSAIPFMHMIAMSPVEMIFCRLLNVMLVVLLTKSTAMACAMAQVMVALRPAVFVAPKTTL